MFQITGAQITAGGTVTVNFTITDSAGVPLDLDGLYTEGQVAPRFVLAWLDQTADGQPLQYTSYFTSSAGQATTDSGGSFTEIGNSQGTYQYQFGGTLAESHPGRTHTIGVFATRTFQGQRYVANTEYDFLPGGATARSTARWSRPTRATSATTRWRSTAARAATPACASLPQPQTVDTAPATRLTSR